MRRFPHAALLLAVALAAGTAAAALAQKKPGGFPIPIPTPFLAKLGLNDDQKARLKAADDAFQAELARVKEQANKDDLKQALAGATSAYRTAVDGTLTPLQKAQVESLMEEAAEYRALGPVAYHLVAMDLSGEQKRKIQETIAKYAGDLEQLGLQAKTNNDANAAERAQQLRTQMMDEITAVLTPDQRKSLPATKKK